MYLGLRKQRLRNNKNSRLTKLRLQRIKLAKDDYKPRFVQKLISFIATEMH